MNPLQTKIQNLLSGHPDMSDEGRALLEMAIMAEEPKQTFEGMMGRLETLSEPRFIEIAERL